VEGCPAEKSGIIRSYLNESKTHRVYSGRADSGQFAVTRYAVLKSGGGYSLLQVNIETGRKNQIRAHLSELGCPVAGDKKYGAGTNPLKRLALHASALEIRNPFTKRNMTFSSPAPQDFQRLFRRR
jgi:23S rRNA pseudouridine1911/1915/1917 synthase